MHDKKTTQVTDPGGLETAPDSSIGHPAPLVEPPTRKRADAELRLWHRLQNRQLGGFRFHRHLMIPPYQVDFACLGRQLIVEIADERCLDQARNRYLQAAGYTTLRFRAGDIADRTDKVIDAVLAALRRTRGRVIV